MTPTHDDARGGFWCRLVQMNARYIAARLREVAAQLEAAAPGPPAIAIVLLYDKERPMSDITIKDDAAPLTASVRFLDSKGNVTPPDTLPAWKSSDEAVATVTASPDGLSATVTPGGLGASVISVTTTETNTGAEITAQGTVTVQAGDTVVGEVTFA